MRICKNGQMQEELKSIRSNQITCHATSDQMGGEATPARIDQTYVIFSTTGSGENRERQCRAHNALIIGEKYGEHGRNLVI